MIKLSIIDYFIPGIKLAKFSAKKLIPFIQERGFQV